MSIQDPTRSEQERTRPEEQAVAPGSEPSWPEAPNVLSLQHSSLPDRVAQKLHSLPYEKQQEVLDFVEFLAQKSQPKRPRRNVRGLWADLDIKVSDEDIAEARREMWGNFPREDV
jgi:hypothetical protein